MTLYFLVKWVHILSSTVLFGTGIGTAFHMLMTHRTGSTAEIARAAKNTVLADWLFTTPAGIVQPLSGLLLIHLVGWPWDAPWLVATYVLYVIALGCWLPVVRIQIDVEKIAAEAAKTGAALPERYHRLFRVWFWLGWPAFIGVIAIFALMIWKPM